MKVKEFLGEWKGKKLKKMKKEKAKSLLSDSIPGIVNFYIKKGYKDKDTVADLFEKMQDEKFPAVLQRVLKDAKESNEEIDIGLAVVLTDFLQAKGDELSDEIGAAYVEAINKLLKKRVKELKKELGMSPNVLTELLVIVPGEGYISDDKYVGLYVNKILNKVYTLAGTTNDKGDATEVFESPKQAAKLFKALFGEDLLEAVAINVLLEKKVFAKNFTENQLKVWELLTAFALKTINKVDDKDKLRKMVEYYCNRRHKDSENGKDDARRIALKDVSKDDYKNLAKVVEKLVDKSKFDKYLG